MNKFFLIIIVLLLIAILTVLVRPDLRQYFYPDRKQEVQKKLSIQAASCIAAIRSSYRLHFHTYPKSKNYTLEKAIKDAKISKSMLDIWNFEVIGNPPNKFIATLRANSSIQTWYDVEDAQYNGFGFD